MECCAYRKTNVEGRVLQMRSEDETDRFKQKFKDYQCMDCAMQDRPFSENKRSAVEQLLIDKSPKLAEETMDKILSPFYHNAQRDIPSVVYSVVEQVV